MAVRFGLRKFVCAWCLFAFELSTLEPEGTEDPAVIRLRLIVEEE